MVFLFLLCVPSTIHFKQICLLCLAWWRWCKVSGKCEMGASFWLLCWCLWRQMWWFREQSRPAAPGDDSASVTCLQHAAIGWRYRIWCWDFCCFEWGSSLRLGKKPCASALEGTCSLAERDKGEKSGPGPDLQHCCHQKAEHWTSCSDSPQKIWLNWIQAGSVQGFGNPKSLWVHIWGSCGKNWREGALWQRGEEKIFENRADKREWQVEIFIPSWPHDVSVVPVHSGHVQAHLCCSRAGAPHSPWWSQRLFVRRQRPASMWLLMALTLWLL